MFTRFGVSLEHIEFQSAPLREGRSVVGHLESGALHVSIRAPAGGAISHRSRSSLAVRMFQSAPLREGRWTTAIPKKATTSVSIRAPAGGAIYNMHYTEENKGNVSIRAPAGGAMLSSDSASSNTRVSIRAPAGGAMG